VRFAVAKAPRDGRADAGGEVGVQDVGVEGHVQSVGAGEVLDGFHRDVGDASPVDVGHREGLDAEVANHGALIGVDGPKPEVDDVFGTQFGWVATHASQAWIAVSEEDGDGHAVHVAGWAGGRRVEVGVRIDP